MNLMKYLGVFHTKPPTVSARYGVNFEQYYVRKREKKNKENDNVQYVDTRMDARLAFGLSWILIPVSLEFSPCRRIKSQESFRLANFFNRKLLNHGK